MIPGPIIERAAAAIDPGAFDEALPGRLSMDLLLRRDQARKMAADVLVIFEAHRLGVIEAGPPRLGVVA